MYKIIKIIFFYSNEIEKEYKKIFQSFNDCIDFLESMHKIKKIDNNTFTPEKYLLSGNEYSKPVYKIKEV